MCTVRMVAQPLELRAPSQPPSIPYPPLPPAALQVHKFNGVAVRNLRHLAEMVLTCTEPRMRFDVDYSEVIVIDTAEAREATEEILRLHAIPAVVSKDLEDVLAAAA